MAAKHPGQTYDAIKEAYLRYYDTAFKLRDGGLVEERRALLERDGVIFTDPLIEPVMPYDSVISISDICDRVGLEGSIADKLATMLFPGNDGTFKLRDHQAKALEFSLSDPTSQKRNILVTAGTGSGKTESFLLPIFARLLAEADRERWSDINEQRYRWWESSKIGTKWRASRANTVRSAAVRTVVLYPTNALVEDQIARLRRSVSMASTNAVNGPQLYFGRYTGATLGTGNPPSNTNNERVRDVAEELRSMEREIDQIASVDLELISEFSDPRGGEQLTRWDMLEYPPDILGDIVKSGV